MANDNNGANGAHRGDISDQKTSQQSQDALRHEGDALHHKFHKGPQPGSTAEKGEPEEQPEIPKVGSRDAPGG
jgi:hypothetical protein